MQIIWNVNIIGIINLLMAKLGVMSHHWTTMEVAPADPVIKVFFYDIPNGSRVSMHVIARI